MADLATPIALRNLMDWVYRQVVEERRGIKIHIGQGNNGRKNVKITLDSNRNWSDTCNIDIVILEMIKSTIIGYNVVTHHHDHTSGVTNITLQVDGAPVLREVTFVHTRTNNDDNDRDDDQDEPKDRDDSKKRKEKPSGSRGSGGHTKRGMFSSYSVPRDGGKQRGDMEFDKLCLCDSTVNKPMHDEFYFDDKQFEHFIGDTGSSKYTYDVEEIEIDYGDWSKVTGFCDSTVIKPTCGFGTESVGSAAFDSCVQTVCAKFVVTEECDSNATRDFLDYFQLDFQYRLDTLSTIGALADIEYKSFIKQDECEQYTDMTYIYRYLNRFGFSTSQLSDMELIVQHEFFSATSKNYAGLIETIDDEVSKMFGDSYEDTNED